MSQMIRCKSCQRYVPANPHIKDQGYCKRNACQRARKSKWQMARIEIDPGYKAHQNESKAKWRKQNPGYSKQYRAEHPDYCDRNRALQKKRDQKRRDKKARMHQLDTDIAKMDALIDKNYINTKGYDEPKPDLAKMDASSQLKDIKPGIYHISPEMSDLAKMDALKVKFIIIPEQYIDLAKMDSFDFQKLSQYFGIIQSHPNNRKQEADDENRKETDRAGSNP